MGVIRDDDAYRRALISFLSYMAAICRAGCGSKREVECVLDEFASEMKERGIILDDNAIVEIMRKDMLMGLIRMGETSLPYPTPDSMLERIDARSLERVASGMLDPAFQKERMAEIRMGRIPGNGRVSVRSVPFMEVYAELPLKPTDERAEEIRKYLEGGGEGFPHCGEDRDPGA